jgi:hypothetical protein
MIHEAKIVKHMFNIEPSHGGDSTASQTIVSNIILMKKYPIQLKLVCKPKQVHKYLAI